MALVIDKSVEVDAPAELVWQVLTDVDRYGEWNPFCIACKTTLEPGTPIDMTVRLIGPSPKKQREYMHSHTPGREFSYRMKPVPGGTLFSERSHTVTPLGADRCRYDSHFKLDGWLSPLVTALLGGALRRGFAGMTDAVKQRAEALRTTVRD